MATKQRLQDAVAEHESVSSVLFATYSGRTDRLQRYAAGTVSADSAEPAHLNSRFHSASVGKTMLAAVYGQLVDDGRVTFDDPVSRWLGASVLDGLFVAGRTAEVTLGQLLSHTSGAADYFEGPVVSGTAPRLTADDWTAAALDAMAGGGLAAVAVEPLAARLGAPRTVSTGILPTGTPLFAGTIKVIRDPCGHDIDLPTLRASPRKPRLDQPILICPEECAGTVARSVPRSCVLI